MDFQSDCMTPIENDIPDREPIWHAMQLLFMDTHEEKELVKIARVCADSKYSLSELESIFYDEVFPACRINLITLPTPAWAGVRAQLLTRRIVNKQRHGRRRLWFLRHQVDRWWKLLATDIMALRHQRASTGS